MPKSSDQWQQFGGAVFPQQVSPKYDPKVSPTKVAADLYSTSFRNQKNGFAVGAICADPNRSLDDVNAGKCDQAAPPGQGGRVPVIYQYTDRLGEGPRWREVYGPELSSPGADRPGFIGAVTWIGPGEALAVGGDGQYPRREQDPSTAANDVAGHARAWLYRGGVWTEITAQLPRDDGHGNPMRGLSAVACPRAGDGAQGVCVAGGFQQIWTYDVGGARFVKPVTGGAHAATRSPESELDNADGFRFRVRSFVFVPPSVQYGNVKVTRIVALTAGCCANATDPPEADLSTPPALSNDPVASHPTLNVPKAIVFDGTRWYTRLVENDPGSGHGDVGANGDPFSGVAVIADGYRSASPKQSYPDSYYAAIATPLVDAGGAPLLSVIATPGGPSQATGSPADPLREPASRIFGRILTPSSNPQTATVFAPFGQMSPLSGNILPTTSEQDATGSLLKETLDPNLSSVRLNSGDGDVTSPRSAGLFRQGQPPAAAAGSADPDGVIDWGVGELTTTGQGVAYTTTASSATVPNPARCPPGSLFGVSAPSNPAGCQADPGATKQVTSQSLIGLSSYQLNSFALIGSTGIGWAVGDKGAIERLGGNSSAGLSAEPAQPTLGSSSGANLSDRSAYDGLTPSAAGQVGAVPALASQPLAQISAAQWVPAGAADPTGNGGITHDVAGIVMSRDGSEGWAYGPGVLDLRLHEQMFLDHYDGSRWSECNPTGVSGQLAADRACGSLAPLADATDPSGSHVKIRTATRIPMENGPDASRANDFEAIAATSAYKGPGDEAGRPALLRLHAGMWTLDTSGTAQLNIPPGELPLSSIAFGAPNDGWAIQDVPYNSTPGIVFHFDGQRPQDGGAGHGWVNCANEPALCGDNPSAPRLAGILHPHLTAVGDRVYLYGYRQPASTSGTVVTTIVTGQSFPVIIYHDRGSAAWSDGAGDAGKPAGLDPGCQSHDPTTHACLASTNAADQGVVESLAVARQSNGDYCGWAGGFFGASSRGVTNKRTPGPPPAPLLRLKPDTGWQTWQAAGDAAGDYLTDPGLDTQYGIPQVTLPAKNCDGPAFIGTELNNAGQGKHPLLTFSPADQRWKVLGAPFELAKDTFASNTEALLQAIAPDAQGGLWAAVTGTGTTRPHGFFYHYTPHVHKPIFSDLAHPVREEITSGAGAGDGSFWVTTNSSAVYRYDRVTGWDRMRIPGWDPGSIVTSASQADAVAVGPDGRGVVVGRGGRIADVGPGFAALNPAAGQLCATGATGVCGTTRELRAAAIAPDGSTLVGGDARTLLWRPAGGSFQSVDRPPAAASATITGISYPRADRAWLTTDKGDVFAGKLSGSAWDWTQENLNVDGDVLALTSDGSSLALHGVAIDAGGHGYAVGDRGLVLLRTGDGDHPWRRLSTRFRDNLHSVALPLGAGNGALIGGENGLIITATGSRLEIARPGDRFGGLDFGFSDASGSHVVGVGVLPGVKDGQVEAWAVQQVSGESRNRSPAPQAIFHYSSDPSEPLLDGGVGRAQPLPDTPVPRPGELRLAAFGKSECRAGSPCPEMTGATNFNELVAARIVDQLTATAHGDAPLLSLFTGDVNDNAGQGTQGATLGQKSETDASISHHNWTQLIASRLTEAGMTLFGALGGQDLSSTQACDPLQFAACQGTGGQRTGSSFAWRQAFAGMPAPWGGGGSGDVAGSTVSPLTSGTPASSMTGGANTHYAFDVKQGSRNVARVVFVDSSLKTLSGSAAAQQPAEEQLTWLDKTLSSRDAGEQAVVVSETPSYSYGPGNGTDTLTDSASVEQILLKDHVNLVVSGRLGWNGLFWNTGTGLHSPCAGADYPEPGSVPAAGTTGCSQAAGAAPGAPAPPDQASQLASSLQSTAAPTPGAQCVGSGDNSTGVMPNIVASSAGGRFGPDGTASGTAAQGFWHGYTTARLDKSGDPRCTIVEQRPVFDWVGIQAAAHVIRPGQHMTLKGYGREAVGADAPISYDQINGPAITHRYDLVQADPQRPWLPKDCGCPTHYTELDPSVAQLDPANNGQQTGRIVTGKGNHPRVYAIGLLSVGGKAASWPLVFEPRRSFVPIPPARVVTPALSVVPQVHVAAIAATSPPLPPSAPPPAPPVVGTPTLPQLPGLPGLPPLSTPPPAAPPPPAGAPPPAPPASQAPTALSISVSPQSVGFAPPSGVVPPPAPPINPAPPGGARREAKAKQPAAAKSEESGAEAEGGSEQSSVDTGSAPYGPTGAAMTRRDRTRPTASFTVVHGHHQASAWSQGALYGGSLALMALVLALGYTTVRPTPRRRPPTVGAPAWASAHRRRPWL
ncbi:MAG TPA: hypothetical protein VGN69_01460 [Solirubrobacteraceae bacterium]|nr:hypothetical protein [Solirubrobacteraceae bacterium]